MPLRCVTHPTPDQFLERVSTHLSTDEAGNNLPLGLARNLCGRPANPADAWLSVEEGSRVVGAAIRTPPFAAVLAHMPPAAVTAVGDHFATRDPALTGVNGPQEASELFARTWAARHGVEARLHLPMWLYRCDVVQRPIRSDARIRTPRPDDRQPLAELVRGFHAAVGGPVTSDPLDAADRLIEHGECLVADCAGELVSLAAIARRTPSGAVVALVYTPPEQRGRGFATDCVGELTQQEFSRGTKFCCLFAHQRNAAANRVYERLGYRCIEPFAGWEFSPPTP